ncbi:MAG: DUF1549 domain-containing protein [Candidatus Hydrogenedentes bacterium]|nr:DUF1549 domain-containing protein [Candidatus Hydrogenedentota bacterium]
MKYRVVEAGVLKILAAVACASAAIAQPAELPVAAKQTVDFANDIHPILAERCADCHMGGQFKGGFSMDSRESFLEGGESGPAVIAENSAESRLIKLVSGADPDLVMPPKGDRLSAEQIGLLRAWIDQGIKWYDVDERETAYVQPIALASPALPAASEAEGSTNPVDRFLNVYFQQHRLEWPEPVSDAVFIRRVYLDTIGLLPPPQEMDAFIADAAPDKHAKLVEKLLGDNLGYAENWMTFWNDHLRNDFSGTGYIDGGRKQITQWLFDALYQNMPYDQFVTQLVNPTPDSEGFVNGIVWRGVTAAAMNPAVQAANTVSQVFLGVNLKCASCHDSFVDHWKLADSYGMAAVFSEEPLEMVRCDVPQGKTAEIRFLWDSVGTVDAKRSKRGRQAQLARVITDENNGFFTRTIVNRLWSEFMGRGMVEPLDKIENAPWNADLQDWLAGDLINNGYNLKHTMALILSSRAYRLHSISTPEDSKEVFVFKGPEVRRMNAEQFLDAIACVTGVWQANPQFAVPEKPRGKDEPAPPPQVRAWRVQADPLTRAMGRPNREQVMTRRISVATALEAVELTNGQTLTTYLDLGAASLVSTPPASTAGLVNAAYRHALQRDATDHEKEVATALVGEPTNQNGVADFLWALTMLPEFQLIY